MPHPFFGRAIIAADFDGDGIDDLAVSSGPTTGLSGYVGDVDVLFSGGAAPITLASAQQQNAPSFGRSLTAGDVNNDGYSDLIVGAPKSQVGGAAGAGEVIVLFGPDLTSQVALRDPQVQSAANFGISVASADANADGFDDVLVGAWDSHVGAYNRAGESFLFLGPGLVSPRTFQSPEPQTVGDFGVATAIGDVDGDSFADLIIGSWTADVMPNRDEGKVFVFRGPQFTNHIRLVDSGAGIQLGRSLAIADVDGDATLDVIAGAHSGVVVFTWDGAGFVPHAVAIPDAGFDVDAGDVNADGFGDVVTGGGGKAALMLGPELAPVHEFLGPETEPADALGTAVSFGEELTTGAPRVFVSATGDDARFENAGVVWQASVDDPDGDRMLGPDDNCPTASNADQVNSDHLPNGPNVEGDDVTLPGSAEDSLGDACDPNDDNDAFADVAEGMFPIAGCASASAATSPLKMDTDGDHLSDKWECDNGSDPASAASKFLGLGGGDADGDHVPDLWEQRGYDAGGAAADSDGDGCHDMVETASIDVNVTVNDADRLAVARRAFGIWAYDQQQDYALDLNKNGGVDDADRLFVARAALLPEWLPKSCP
jgi:hypothetical protein